RQHAPCERRGRVATRRVDERADHARVQEARVLPEVVLAVDLDHRFTGPDRDHADPGPAVERGGAVDGIDALEQFVGLRHAANVRRAASARCPSSDMASRRRRRQWPCLKAQGSSPARSDSACENTRVMTTRTRFAPSPTGFLHLGGIRSALYPWAFARST